MWTVRQLAKQSITEGDRKSHLYTHTSTVQYLPSSGPLSRYTEHTNYSVDLLLINQYHWYFRIGNVTKTDIEIEAWRKHVGAHGH